MEHFEAEACFHGSETSSGFRQVSSIFQEVAIVAICWNNCFMQSFGSRISAPLQLLLLLFFTLGIKDPEGFGKKLEENVSE